MVFLILLVAIGVIAYRATTAEERQRFFHNIKSTFHRTREAAGRSRPERQPFVDALHARTPRVLVTPAIAALQTIVFVLMRLAPGALTDPQTLVRWGASFGPRTTHGEWWRLVTATLVNPGFFLLLVNLLAFVPVAAILERLAGPAALLAVFVGSGVLANVVALWLHPMTATAGSLPAILAVYGLFTATLLSPYLRHTGLTIPWIVLRRLIPGAVVFVLYTLAVEDLSWPELTGFVFGAASGAALWARVPDTKPPLVRVAATAATVLVIVVASIVPIRGVADVRPEIEHIAAVEQHTAATYEAAVAKFRKDRVSAESLAQLIDATIVPELRAAKARLEAIDGVPPEHQPLVNGAREYFRLRNESWTLRASGLRKTNMLALRKAEAAERAALEELQRITTTSGG